MTPEQMKQMQLMNSPGFRASVQARPASNTPPTAPQMQPAPQPMQQQAPEQGLLARMGAGINNFRQDPEKMARLTMGLNSMRLNPDQGIAASAANTIQTAQEQRRLQGNANSSIKMLQAAADKGDKLAKTTLQAIQANPSDYMAYINAYAKESIKLRKQVKQLSGKELNELSGRGVYDDQAMYNVTNGPEGQQVSKIGGGGTTVYNNAAAKQPAGLEALDKAYATDHLDWTRGGGADMAANVAQINTVLQKLQEGEQLTGPMIGMLSNMGLLGLVNPKAENAKEMVQEVVQRNLKTILGAQFAQKEGEQLISRAYNPLLPAEDNARRLNKLYQQMEIARQQRQAMADYFQENYTLRGYTGPQPNISDFYTALQEIDVGHVSEGHRYLGGDIEKESSWEKVGN